MEKEIKRSEVDVKNTWNLDILVKDETDFNEKLKRSYELLDELVSFKGHILDSSDTLLAFYKKEEEYDRVSMIIYLWAHLNMDTDTTDSDKQDFVEKIDHLLDVQSEKLSFVLPEMMKTPYEKVLKMIEGKKEFNAYLYDLEVTYRYQKHTLSEQEENLLGNLAGVFGNNKNTFAKLNNADIDLGTLIDENGDEVKVTNATYTKYMESKDRRVREDAFDRMYTFWKNHKNTVATLYKGQVKEDVIAAKIRKYNSSLEQSLFGDNISVSFYKKIIYIIHQHLQPMYKYLSIRKDRLGVDKLHMYDLYVNIAEQDTKEYSFEEGKKILFEALKPLGETYLNDLSEAFRDRWIDIYPNKGKRSGAYQWSCYDSKPYVLLNYNDTLDSVSTMGHELGHAMHSYYSMKYQPYISHDYPIVLAEIASTVNEVLINDYLVKHAKTKEEKICYLTDFLDMVRATIYRQMMFAEFEMKTHEKEENGDPLTEKVLSDTYYELNKLYYGENVVSDDLIRYEWERVSHFYTSFYVYKYATGLSAALAFSKGILDGTPGALDKYLTFLSSGSKADPFDILKEAGLDMESGAPVEEALKLFQEKVDELEKLCNE